jgi:hypothetical protein
LSPLSFGVYVLGTFFDNKGNKLWEREVFIYHKDSRGISVDETDVDEGPTPPPFALEGKYMPSNTDLCC